MLSHPSHANGAVVCLVIGDSFSWTGAWAGPVSVIGISVHAEQGVVVGLGASTILGVEHDPHALH